jgi:hypothetical protein
MKVFWCLRRKQERWLSKESAGSGLEFGLDERGQLAFRTPWITRSCLH